MRYLTAFALVLVAVLLTGFGRDDPPPGKASGRKHDHESAAELAKHMGQMNEKMVKALGGKDAEYEKRFIDLMIPHHEGAVRMAKDALEHATRPELKAMAKKMIEDQEKEIEQLKAWRKEWYGERK
ncbi:MAG: DUF305 domain-containing protein [Gemmataceae bacterium]|nr:DUF305 domain-containing protein [Gemmataceae bacterium]